MTERLNNDFQFIEVGRTDPKKKLLRQRKKEFVEIYEPFKPQQACEQADQGEAGRQLHFFPRLFGSSGSLAVRPGRQVRIG